MREKKLSKRLQAVADMVPKGSRVADVGCDHAYVSIYLMEHAIAARCLALDVRKGPLERAKVNIETHHLSSAIETRLGSGLMKVQSGEIDTVLMAGMGGILVRDLLEESRELAGELRAWILQPQSDIYLVRQYIRENGFRIVEENLIREDGKYYPMFRAVPVEDTMESSQEEWLAVYDRFGPLLLAERHPLLLEYLLQGKEHYRRILKSMKEEQVEETKGSLDGLAEELAEAVGQAEWARQKRKRRLRSKVGRRNRTRNRHAGRK